MIHSDVGAQEQHTDEAQRLLGCSVRPLSALGSGIQGAEDRIAFLLDWMVGVARGESGVVLLDSSDGSDRLTVRACVGLRADTLGAIPGSTDAMSFGLIVHGAELDEDAFNGDQAEDADAQAGGRHGTDGVEERRGRCAHGVVDEASRMTICLPLEASGRVLGAVQIGYAELRTLDPAEIRRLGMIADHLASAADAERLACESAAHLDEVQRLRSTLAQVDRLKNDFLSMISHELRTPLTAIIGYTDLLLRQIHGALTDRQARHQQAVKKAAHRLLALINDLLDLNRLEGGHVVLNLESISLADAVQRAVAESAGAAEQRAVELRLDAPLADSAVRADRERLHQVLVNLLDNAVKFTPAQGSVTVRVDHHDGHVAVSIVDTGIGVPADHLDLIWDRFHQADSSARRQYGGSGLGLAIVRHLVELHGGTVSASSDGPDQGSTFRFTLPTTTQAMDRPGDAPPLPAIDALPASPSRTVLIVDDEPDNREVITSIVKDVLGYRVDTAANGAEALERARACPDLVLLDLRMPNMNGFDVARTLKRDPLTASIPIVAITALDDEDDRRDATEAGCVGCVTKPFSGEELASAVRSVLAQNGSQPGAATC